MRGHARGASPSFHCMLSVMVSDKLFGLNCEPILLVFCSTGFYHLSCHITGNCGKYQRKLYNLWRSGTFFCIVDEVRGYRHITSKTAMADNNSDDDASMTAAHEETADVIRRKISNLAANETIHGTFERKTLQTEQLKSLRDAQPQSVVADENIGSEAPELHRYNISMEASPVFLGLACEPEVFYARRGYRELHDYVAGQWDDRKKFRVILLGNAGTGKSWFQVYALKRLLDDPERKFDIVIRQVGSTIYVVDLAEASVYTWNVATNHIEDISQQMRRSLYFFEPGANPTMPPLDVVIPTLATLSPFVDRIKEYRKRFCEFAFFWPWSLVEMWTVVCDSNISMDLDELQKRYTKFGGILRNVLGEEVRADEELTGRLKEISLEVLTSIALNVDREPKGNNVSGYLVCYDNRLVEQNRFSTKNLEYTSLKVEEEVATKLRTKPLRDKMQVVLNRLNGEALDMSGKILEDVAMELISQGRACDWVTRRVGAAEWVPFATNKRTIKRIYNLAENLTQADLIIGPTNTNFPVIDFVLSCPEKTEKAPVFSFQCTWQRRHPFQARELYDLRNNHMQVEDDQIVNIYIVCPSEKNALANSYASMPKEKFLQGSLDADLKFTKAVTVPSWRLQAMWSSTNIWVLSPKKTWQECVTNWLSENP